MARLFYVLRGICVYIKPVQTYNYVRSFIKSAKSFSTIKNPISIFASFSLSLYLVFNNNSMALRIDFIIHMINFEKNLICLVNRKSSFSIKSLMFNLQKKLSYLIGASTLHSIARSFLSDSYSLSPKC